MKDLFIIACGAGLRDGLNPCFFMACAVLLAASYWLGLGNLQQRFMFVLVYAASSLLFNFGPAQVIVLQSSFVLAAKVLYLILGILAFIAGILFLKDWYLLSRGLPVKSVAQHETRPSWVIVLASNLLIVLLGVVLSMMATLWPIDRYVMLLGNAGLLRGQWQETAPLLLTYIFISMWPLWLLWLFLSVKKLRPSMVKIICAAIFFTASSCMILIFK